MLNRISRAINHYALGGAPDETVCGRCYRESWPLRHIIDAACWMAADPDNCLTSGKLPG